MNATYENRRRDDDGHIRVTAHATRTKAIDDVAMLIEDGDEHDYDGTFVVHRDRLGRPVRADAVSLLAAAWECVQESEIEAREARTDPYPKSWVGSAAA